MTGDCGDPRRRARRCRRYETTFLDLRNGLDRKRGAAGARNVKIIFALRRFQLSSRRRSSNVSRHRRWPAACLALLFVSVRTVLARAHAERTNWQHGLPILNGFLAPQPTCCLGYQESEKKCAALHRAPLPTEFVPPRCRDTKGIDQGPQGRLPQPRTGPMGARALEAEIPGRVRG